MMVRLAAGTPDRQQGAAVLSSAWDDSLTTGVPSIDAQHRRLIGILGNVLDAMEHGHSRTEIGRVLEELDRYTAAHFSHEEDCMRRYECPAAQLNESEHAEFLRIVSRFRADYEAQGATTKLVLRVRDQLAWWLETHIRAIDTQLYSCVRALGTAASSPASSERQPGRTT
jgi:hemerythrin